MKLLFENWRKYLLMESDPAVDLLRQLSTEKTFHGLTPELSIQIFLDGIRNGTYPLPQDTQDIERIWDFVSSIFDPHDTSHLDDLYEDLYYGTSTIFQEEIAKNGIKSPSIWGSYGLAEKNAIRLVKEHGGEPMVIQMPLTEFDRSKFKIDENNNNLFVYTETFLIGLQKQEKKLL